MGLFDFLKSRRKRNGLDRFAPLPSGEELLLPKQVEWLVQNVNRANTEVLSVQDTSDEMLPECAFFLPNLLAEFTQNNKLAMLHGLGKAHAWILTSALREATAASPGGIRDYRSLCEAFQRLGYEVKLVRYVRFRSAIGESF